MLIVFYDKPDEELINKVLKILENKKISQKEFYFNTNRILEYLNFTIDTNRRVIKKCEQEIMLTYKEFEILHLLAAHPGQVFSKEQIYDIVWNEPYSGDYNIVMTHIRHIRTKLEDDPAHPFYIQTVWGVGYRFNKNASSEL